VADEKREAPRPFDVKTVEYLLGLMTKHELSEVDLQEGEQRIRLRKGFAPPAGSYAPPAVAHPLATAPPPPAASDPVAPPAAPAKKLLEIKSPMVGTFYAKAAPEKPDYVKVGDRVKPDTVVCKIEAMKIFNDHLAECSGTVAEVCVKNGDFVEFGTVLFRVDPS
jgi:acetyl-CoA carboxylase biotin carboxyl carrier protein